MCVPLYEAVSLQTDGNVFLLMAVAASVVGSQAWEETHSISPAEWERKDTEEAGEQREIRAQSYSSQPLKGTSQMITALEQDTF